MEGTQIADTSDYYEDIRKRYPESLEAVDERIDSIRDHYMDKHAQSRGKSIAYFVVTHEGFVKKMQRKFTDVGAVAYFCASFETIIKNNEEPVVIRLANNDYIT